MQSKIRLQILNFVVMDSYRQNIFQVKKELKKQKYFWKLLWKYLAPTSKHF